MQSNLIIVLGISEQEDFHRPEIPLEKTQESITKLELQRKPK